MQLRSCPRNSIVSVAAENLVGTQSADKSITGTQALYGIVSAKAIDIVLACGADQCIRSLSSRHLIFSIVAA